MSEILNNVLGAAVLLLLLSGLAAPTLAASHPTTRTVQSRTVCIEVYWTDHPNHSTCSEREI